MHVFRTEGFLHGHLVLQMPVENVDSRVKEFSKVVNNSAHSPYDARQKGGHDIFRNKKKPFFCLLNSCHHLID